MNRLIAAALAMGVLVLLSACPPLELRLAVENIVARNTPPQAPTELSATAVSASIVRLDWKDNSANEASFTIERSHQENDGFTSVGLAPADATSYDDGALAADTTYYYRVCATNGTGNSEYTAVAGTTTPLAGQVATPLISPTDGTYTNDQPVTIGCTTADATIHYTIDGTTPTTASTVYTASFSVSGHGTTVTVKAMATKAGMSPSEVASATITIDYQQVSTPQFAPPQGTYNEPQTVTITCFTGGATIRYTTNGDTPTQNVGTAIASGGLVSIPNTLTLRAVAYLSGMLTSTVAMADFTIVPLTPSGLQVTNPGYYTLDVSWNPVGSATSYEVYWDESAGGPFSSLAYAGTDTSFTHGSLGADKTYYYRVRALIGSEPSALSGAVSGTTVLDTLVLTPTFSPPAGAYTSDQSVELSCATADATIHFTTDNTAPTTSSPVYGSAISVAGHGTTMTVRAIAAKAGMDTSGEASATYTISYPPVAAPTFTPPAGIYTTDQSVAIECATADAIIHFTTDNTAPTTSSPVYGSPISVAGHGTTMTVRAIAAKAGMATSGEGSASYEIRYQVATPTFSKTPGTYDSDQSIALICATGGATIHYTTDGSTPTESSAEYSASITTNGHGTTMTIRAIGVLAGMTTSEVASATYTISDGPEINLMQGATTIPDGGSYDFGSADVDFGSATRTFTIENLGNRDLSFILVSVSADPPFHKLGTPSGTLRRCQTITA